MKNIICLIGLIMIFGCAFADAYKDQDLVAAVLVEEAWGEGNQGMILVMNVIENRGKRDSTKYAGVVLKKKQFSCLNEYTADGSWGITLFISKARLKQPGFDNALEIVNFSYTHGLLDQTRGADHYHAAGVEPYWADLTKVTCSYRKHTFYRLGSHP